MKIISLYRNISPFRCPFQQIHWPSGKVLGGSSMINHMIYSRGSRHDYDGWKAQGCTGWGYDDVMPYFLKAEGNQNQMYKSSGIKVLHNQLN